MRTDDPGVTLRPLDEPLLRALLETAAADAEPAEVMPPVDAAEGTPGWTPDLRTAFLRFHRSRSLTARPVERTYAVLVRTDGAAGAGGTGGAAGLPDGPDGPGEGTPVAGAARLAPLDDAGTWEAGIWLGRTYRARGVGTAALRDLFDRARALGALRLVARTTTGNTAACRMLATLGAHLTEGVDGEEDDGEGLTATLSLRTAQLRTPTEPR